MSKDIIYREDAIKAIKSCIQDGWYRISPTDACQNIRCLPSADRLQGEWIIEMDANSNTYGRCSICGMRQYAGQLNFCPDCGARMKGANDEVLRQL